jgi:hypothetical protein
LVQAAIQSGFTGQDGGSRARIGSKIYASRYYGDVSTLGTWAQIIDIQLGTDAIPTCAFVAAISGMTMTVSQTGAAFTGTGSGTNLTVTAITGTILPGMVLSGTGVPGGTTIVSQTSGTIGGAGVYVTSVSTTSSSASLTATNPIAVGQFVYGTNVAPGTIITALGSGTGGNGTYVVAVNQIVTSEAMTSVIADNNSVQMQIDWLPTLQNADINLILV